MQEKCRHLVEGVDTLQLVLHIFPFMLDLCTSCLSSALRAWPLQLVAELGTLQLVVELGNSCLSSALRARSLKLVADLDYMCLNSAACAQVSLRTRPWQQQMFELCNSCSSSALRAGPLQLVADLNNECLSSALRAGPLQLVADLDSKCLSSATPGARVLHLVVDFGSLCLSLSARSSCSSRDFAARYCRTPRGLLGAAWRCSLPSADGEQEAVADVHGVFMGKFFAPPNGSVMRRGRLNASALN
ncbi:hypothetical protein SLEP1_g54654 [Rubroshorea leprosula]|uniref:Uncharacterized protein n=1 Tax=Rubroshorea leprosula TaxID=152421 RepID=A0AAV5ME90_9ROSI|nr:hypothetical protein SLEP1_g54654 [Rubroshorea leprosula]